MSGEVAAERWSPAQSAESVLISILSLFDDAEVSSPANVDAGVMLRKNPTLYKERVKQDLERSKCDIPEGFVMPTHETAFATKKEEEYNMSWEDSDMEDDFGGSDSEMETTFDDDDEEAAESPPSADEEEDE